MHLEAPTSRHVQTFARELGPSDDADAMACGYPSARAGYWELVAHSLEAHALCAEERVIAMCGVLNEPRSGGTARLWVHTAPCFKAAGLGALRTVRELVLGLVERHGELTIDIDSQSPALVRMADWLGFKHLGFVTKAGRPWHHAVLRGGRA